MMAGNHLTETFVYSVGFRGGARGTWAPSLSEGLDDPQPPPPIPRSVSGTSLLPSFATKA